METWLHDTADKPISYYVYKKMFTPYEMDKKYVDESIYEWDQGTEAFIEEAIELSNGDWLLGFREFTRDAFDDIDERMGYVTYYRLSEILLRKYDEPQQQEE